MAVSAAGNVGSSIAASLRVEQAQRSAERAEQQARILRASADRAQQVADREQERARSLGSQASRAQDAAGQARLGLAAIQTSERNLQNLGQRVEQSVAARAAAKVVEAPPVAPAPAVAESGGGAVVNSEGQTTGTLINVSA